jgi:hypothetical protein
MRAKFCYLCGTKLTSATIFVAMVLDRRERDVHSRCALRETKRLKDIERR